LFRCQVRQQFTFHYREGEEKPPIDTSDHSDPTAITMNATSKRKRGGQEGPRSRKTKRAPKPPPRRARARIGTRRAKIDQEKSESAESKSETESESEVKEREDQEQKSEVKTRYDQDPTIGAQIVKFEDKSMDLELEKTNRLKDEILKGEIFDKSHDEEIEENASKGVNKLEQMVDPIHAMLLDMIPSLSQRKEETGTSCSNENKKADTGEVPAQPGPSISTPKKKVSYKDVAGQLLKDW
jgi:DNA ligase 4